MSGSAPIQRSAPSPSCLTTRRYPELDQALHFSADDILKHLFVQADVRYEPLEPNVLFIQLLQALNLRWHQSTIFTAPSVVRLDRNAGLPARLLDGRAILGLFENKCELLLAD